MLLHFSSSLAALALEEDPSAFRTFLDPDLVPNDYSIRINFEIAFVSNDANAGTIYVSESRNSWRRNHKHVRVHAARSQRGVFGDGIVDQIRICRRGGDANN